MYWDSLPLTPHTYIVRYHDRTVKLQQMLHTIFFMLRVSLYGIHPGKNHGQYNCVEAVMRNSMNCFMDNQWNIKVLISWHLKLTSWYQVPCVNQLHTCIMNFKLCRFWNHRSWKVHTNGTEMYSRCILLWLTFYQLEGCSYTDLMYVGVWSLQGPLVFILALLQQWV